MALRCLVAAAPQSSAQRERSGGEEGKVAPFALAEQTCDAHARQLATCREAIPAP